MWKTASRTTGGEAALSVMTFALFSSRGRRAAGGEGERRAAGEKGESLKLDSESDCDDWLVRDGPGKGGD